MPGQLRLQPTLESGLDQSRDEALSAGQVKLASIDLGEDLIQRPRGGHLRGDLSAALGLFICHEVHRRPFRWTEPLHRESDTPDGDPADPATPAAPPPTPR